MFDLFTLLAITTVYLVFIFIIATAAEKHWIPSHVLQHPIIYTLSLGGYIGTWAIFGSIELARTNGYAFLAYYFGTSALFIFSPLLLQPLLRLSRTYRLSSLADLFSFRYSSQLAGILVSLGTLATVLPLLALQISTVSQTVNFLFIGQISADSKISHSVPLIFCLMITIFTIRFGSKHLGTHSRHEGLVLATAVQSFIKLIIFLSLGFVALYCIFDSPLQLEEWLNAHPENLALLNDTLVSNDSRTLMLIFFAASLSFPHMYHLAITENRNVKSLNYASWAFPVYLLLLSLPVLPILWAGQASNSSAPAYFIALAMGKITEYPSLSILAYICGLAAASSSMIVIIISVASMCLNHFILPYYQPQQKNNVYAWLRFVKSALMIALVFCAFIIYESIDTLSAFKAFGFAAYSAAFQFLPGILAVFYWPRGNRTGLIAGLITGFTSWGIIILLPLISPNAWGLQPILEQLFNLNGEGYLVVAASACLGFNMLVFGAISLTTKIDEEQLNAAEICSQDNFNSPIRHHLSLHSIEEFIVQLSAAIGSEIANNEVKNALKELNMNSQETRPFALRLLRNQIESNLSGLLGPILARQLVNRQIPYTNDIDLPAITDIQLIEHRLEHRLENFPSNFSGLAAELDILRRYHRNTLEHLPIGVCTFNSDNEIQMWNKSIETLTGITSLTAVGSSISSLVQPWQSTFIDFINNPETQLHKQSIIINNQTRWFTLHKANPPIHAIEEESQTILLEEVSQLAKLEQELLHNERLASIGRLAAGVAHEIGNPITGIACLAQNLKYDSDQPEIIQAAKDILTQTQRVTRIVQSLVNFAHAGAHQKVFNPEPVNLYWCAEEAIHLLSLDQRNATEFIHNNINQSHQINGDTQRLLQVFLNLMKNAIFACDENISITLESKLVNGMIELRVSDNGTGIPKELQEQIFEPFFTTKDPVDGTGLGLSVVYSIIEEHHGHISILSPTNTHSETQMSFGSSFVIQLPALT